MLKVVKGKLSEVAKDIEGIPERRMKRALKQGVCSMPFSKHALSSLALCRSQAVHFE